MQRSSVEGSSPSQTVELEGSQHSGRRGGRRPAARAVSFQSGSQELRLETALVHHIHMHARYGDWASCLLESQSSHVGPDGQRQGLARSDIVGSALSCRVADLESGEGRGRVMRRSRAPSWASLWPQAGARWDHRRSAVVDRLDDLACVDSLEVDRRDREVHMPEVPLDDRQRDPFVLTSGRPRRRCCICGVMSSAEAGAAPPSRYRRSVRLAGGLSDFARDRTVGLCASVLS